VPSGGALGYCRRAFRRGRDDPWVLSWAAATLMGLGEDIAETDRLAEHSLAISPGSATSLLINGWIKTVQARSELAISNFEQSLRLDPRSPWRPFHRLGMRIARFAQRRFDEALALIAETVQALPDYPQARGFQIACLAHLGRLNEAREIWQRAPNAFDAALVLMRDPAARELLTSTRTLLAAKVGDG
jgi:adenylate cyclase